ncbi:MAG: cytochrome P450 [Myxococcota bacterium]|jgi:cytochrome P450
MIELGKITGSDIKHPLNLTDQRFIANKPAYYKWMREEAPVYRAKISMLKVFVVSRYDDCVALTRDARFVRNRSTATGGSRLPFPMPKSIKHLAQSMILEDDPEHRRLRNLVQKAFTPRMIAGLEPRIERLTGELLDGMGATGDVDLQKAYALPIPVTVIAEMLGITAEKMLPFQNSMKVLSDGLSGWSLLRTLFWDLRQVSKFIRTLIAEKRADPQDDILSALVEAEEDGDRLTEDELIAMVFLLIVAGYETTVHLISNGVLALLQHPEQLERLRAEPELIDSAVEEMLRYAGPIHASKQEYATEDVTLHGVTIPKGHIVMPFFGAANRDPAVFEKPEEFDIARTPNKHLSFGHGPHFCLGASLARMETRIAVKALLGRHPNLRLSVPVESLKLQRLPGWHRYENLPITLG